MVYGKGSRFGFLDLRFGVRVEDVALRIDGFWFEEEV